MKVDSGLTALDLHAIPAAAKEIEELGFDAMITAETSHDPLFPLLLAAEHTERVQLMTSIVVAFARSPMTLAAQAHDLNSYSKGRLVLGLGSQIKPHITKRFSMPWSKPAARMREFILAMRAVWDCWYQGKPLDFRGEFYTHTLMTPMFTPQDTQYGAPKVVLAAVGPLMSRVAGEVADGLIAHAFTTKAYMEKVTLPAIAEGLERSGRSRDDFELIYPGFVVTGPDDETFEATRTAVCKQIAFYGSTPAYRPVLETHGWGELQDELNFMSKRGEWDEMGTRITDEILNEFAVVGQPNEIVPAFKERFGGVVDRTTMRFAWADDSTAREMVAELQS
ncbi:MAG: TIGR03617 family F420-dependent LLM class oxidoreductase [Acidobacteriota bacterium]